MNRVILLSIYVFAFFLMEYLYLPFEGDTTPVKIWFKDFTIRLDSYTYFFCIKVEQLIYALTAQLVMPFILPSCVKHLNWLVLTFFLAVIEYPLTYNEPIYKIMLPDFGGWQPYVPISVATLKFIAVCYFMYGVVKKALDDR